MLIRNIIFAFFASVAALGALAPMSAAAQTCAEEDLRCRVTQLEARLAALEAAPRQRTVLLEPTEMVSARRTCRSDCGAEAAAVCTERGYAGGTAADWERPRSGPVTLTRAECRRAPPQ